MKRVKKVARVIICLLMSMLIMFDRSFVIYAEMSNESPLRGANQDYTIFEHYQYNIVPGTKEWDKMANVIERREACFVSPDIGKEMTTMADYYDLFVTQCMQRDKSFGFWHFSR